MTERHLVRVTVSAIVFYNNKLLCIRERDGEHEFYSEPVGHLEKGEIPEQAVVREVYEETGIRIQVQSLFGVYLVSRFGKILSDSIRFTYLADYQFGDLRPTETISPEWASLHDVQKLWPNVMRTASRMAISAFLENEAGIAVPDTSQFSDDTSAVIYQSSIMRK